MEKDGYAAAFNDPRVLLAAIREREPPGAIAVAYVEFAGPYEVKTVRVLAASCAMPPSARALTDALTASAPRSFYGRTSISAGIDRAMHAAPRTSTAAVRGRRGR